MLELRYLSKKFHGSIIPALDNVDLKVKDGEILGLVGMNGAGKTTAMRLSTGVLSPSSGTVLVDGLDITRDKIRASMSIGWIPEYPNFDPVLKPMELLKYFGGLYKIGRKTMEIKGIELLKKVGLETETRKRLRTYSQGMKKRFAIAVAMINEPQNYLFDETFNGLDPQGIRMLRNLILNLREKGKAILFSSHILSELETIADRVAIIDKGKILDIIDRGKIISLKESGKNLEDYFFEVTGVTG